MFGRRLSRNNFFILILILVSSSTFWAQDVLLSPSPLFLGKIPIGSSSEREITIFNTTVNQITVNSITVTGQNSSLFTIVDNPGSLTLGAIAKAPIVIRYSPTSAERNTAIFRIETSAGTFTDSLDGYGIPNTGGVQPFERILGTSEPDGASNLRQTSDGGYIIAGNTLPPGDDYESFYLVKTDINGKFEWSSMYGDTDGIDTGSDVEQTSDGGYLVLGSTENWGSGGLNMMLLKFDSNGDFVWRKTYGGSNDDAGTAIIKTSDGGYVLVGQTVPSGGIGKSIFIVKVNSDGVEQWSNNFGNGADGSSIVELSDGNLIVAGYTTVGNDFQVYLIKVSSSGNLVWEKNFGGADYDVGYAVNKLNDGNLIVAGYTSSKGAGARDGYLLKISTDGNLIWDKTFGFERSDEFKGVVEAPDGSIVAAGITVTRVTQNEQFNSAYIVKTTSDGTEIWSQIYGGNLNDHFSEVRISNDGGYICIGGTASFSKSGDIYLVKTGSSGVISNVDDQNENTLLYSFELMQNYPNPFNPSTIIKFSIPKSENVKLKLYDLLGNEIMTLLNEKKAAGLHEVNFDSGDLSSGVYFYQLIYGKNQLTRKMMLLK